MVGWLPVTSGQSFINNDVIGCTGTHRRQRGQHTLHIYLKFYGSGPGRAKMESSWKWKSRGGGGGEGSNSNWFLISI